MAPAQDRSGQAGARHRPALDPVQGGARPPYSGLARSVSVPVSPPVASRVIL
ncbi:hypothetical protein LV75_006901 [Actinokineospora diospyrosa]|uniref:Uncharacterized protein n=1 Tax=Actinokineospora diospyrosa TaxID=103728 RepID=A0ABT1IQE0_9PSEU|nr:hypothetical protein [Actinokineospora diospyrosa]